MSPSTVLAGRLPLVSILLLGLLAGCLGSAEEEGPGPACPEDLRVVERQPQAIRLAWNGSEGAETYNVYRGGDELHRIGTVNETAYTDESVRADAPYSYEVRAVNATGEAEDCPSVEAAAIPFFEGPVAVALAALGGVGVLAGLRRRS